MTEIRLKITYQILFQSPKGEGVKLESRSYWLGVISQWSCESIHFKYHQTCNISCTLVGNKIVDPSDVFGASSPVGAAPTTSSLMT